MPTGDAEVASRLQSLEHRMARSEAHLSSLLERVVHATEILERLDTPHTGAQRSLGDTAKTRSRKRLERHSSDREVGSTDAMPSQPSPSAGKRRVSFRGSPEASAAVQADQSASVQPVPSFLMPKGKFPAALKTPRRATIVASRMPALPQPSVPDRTAAASLSRRRVSSGASDHATAQPDDSGVMGLLHRVPLRDTNDAVVFGADVLYMLTALVACCIAVVGSHRKGAFDIDELPAPWLIVWVCAFQLFSVAWMLLRGLFVRRAVGDWAIADSHEQLLRIYTRSWLVLDVIVSVPVELIFLGWLNQAFYYAMLRHFLRFFRMWGLLRGSNPLIPRRPTITFVSCCGIWLFAIFAFGAVFAAIEPNHFDGDMVTALYWATATMTSTGYGDVVTTTNDSRAFSVFAMIVSVVMISFLQAYSTSLLTNNDVVQEETNQKKKTMHSMLNYFEVPWSVQKAVITTFPAVLDAERERNFKAMITSLPPNVADDVEHFIAARVVRDLPFMAPVFESGVDVAGLSNRVAELLTLRTAMAMEYICEHGNRCFEATILMSGAADIIGVVDGEEVIVKTARRGNTIGLTSLAGKSVQLEYAISCQAIQKCEFYVLNGDDYAELAETYPQLRLLLCQDDAGTTRECETDDDDDPTMSVSLFRSGPTPSFLNRVSRRQHSRGAAEEPSFHLQEPPLNIPAADSSSRTASDVNSPQLQDSSNPMAADFGA